MEIKMHLVELDNTRLFPLILSEAQIEAIPCRDRVFAILAKKLDAPSVKASLSSGSLCEIAAHVDGVFRSHLEHYQNLISSAIQKDSQTLERLEATPKVNILKYLLNPLIRIICGLWRSIMGYRANIRLDAAASRLASLIAIGTLENKRLSEMKTVIIEATKPIIYRLKRLIDKGEVDVTLLNTLRQLEKIYRGELGEPLIVGEEDVSKLLSGPICQVY
jgi:hypothetical protein